MKICTIVSTSFTLRCRLCANDVKMVVLLNHFLHMFCDAYQLWVPEVTPDAVNALTAYPWPGNAYASSGMSQSDSRCGVERDESVSTCCRSRSLASGAPVAASPAAVVVPSGSQMILDRILNDGASFWAEVYEPFMARDITRHDVRELVRLDSSTRAATTNCWWRISICRRRTTRSFLTSSASISVTCRFSASA